LWIAKSTMDHQPQCFQPEITIRIATISKEIGEVNEKIKSVAAQLESLEQQRATSIVELRSLIDQLACGSKRVDEQVVQKPQPDVHTEEKISSWASDVDAVDKKEETLVSPVTFPVHLKKKHGKSSKSSPVPSAKAIAPKSVWDTVKTHDATKKAPGSSLRVVAVTEIQEKEKLEKQVKKFTEKFQRYRQIINKDNKAGEQPLTFIEDANSLETISLTKSIIAGVYETLTGDVKSFFQFLATRNLTMDEFCNQNFVISKEGNFQPLWCFCCSLAYILKDFNFGLKAKEKILETIQDSGNLIELMDAYFWTVPKNDKQEKIDLTDDLKAFFSQCQ